MFSVISGLGFADVIHAQFTQMAAIPAFCRTRAKVLYNDQHAMGVPVAE
jgi:hypothetical protein